MKDSVRRVAEALRAQGLAADVREFAASTRTAQDAASAIGTTIGQIVKSLVFIAGEQPILALVSGSNRVDEARLGALVGGGIARADATAVRAATGYAIGGVPPIGHGATLPTYIDRDLMAYPVVWAAAGTPNAVFSIAPADLARVSSGRIADFVTRPA